MKKMSTLLAAVVMTASAGGCCGGNCFRQPQPVAYAPACPPPAPACDPCTTAPVTYGAAPVMPVAPYAPPPQW